MKFWFLNKPQMKDDDSEIQEKIILEYLRQVRNSHNVALGVTAVSAFMILFGVGLVYIDKIPAATLTASSGTLATITSFQFARQSKEELQKVMSKLSDDDL